jgi:ankyrin repeat protein
MSFELYYACKEGNVDLVASLLNEGYDINGRYGGDGNTYLMKAAMHGQTDVVDLLIGRGADFELKENSGYTALMLTMYDTAEVDTAKLLLDTGSDWTVETEGDTFLSLCSMGGEEVVAEMEAYIEELGLNNNNYVSEGEGENSGVEGCESDGEEWGYESTEGESDEEWGYESIDGESEEEYL